MQRIDSKFLKWLYKRSTRFLSDESKLTNKILDMKTSPLLEITIDIEAIYQFNYLGSIYATIYALGEYLKMYGDLSFLVDRGRDVDAGYYGHIALRENKEFTGNYCIDFIGFDLTVFDFGSDIKFPPTKLTQFLIYYDDINAQMQVFDALSNDGKGETKKIDGNLSYIDLSDSKIELLFTMLLPIYGMLDWANENMKIPVIRSKAPPSNPKEHKEAKHCKKPWQNYYSPSLIFIDELPREKNPPQGGHGKEKRAHWRRGTKRTLKADIYKHHPMYQVHRGVPVNGSYVGDKDQIIMGNRYRILA